ncbi:zf-HC2 domain-containing protein [Nonomuraea sp. CA-218870]|uniref:zf-HC2 domain-containing protein n=1 Tax=Nonomuraea sp. CA-218870 TaxID=3239998 RepID=UPI003D89B817
MSVESPQSDAHLLHAVRTGDATAYGQLHERHVTAARTLAAQLVADEAEIGDVVAASFARVLDQVSRGGGPAAAFRPFLLATVRRTVAYRTRATSGIDLFDPADDPATVRLEGSLIAQAYLALPERRQAVLWHTEVENARPADVAPLLGLSANGVAALAYRAREGLRQAYLRTYLTGGPPSECRTVIGRLGAYVRGGLTRRDTRAVDEHVGDCPNCHTVLRELTDVTRGLRAVVGPLVLGAAAGGYLAAMSRPAPAAVPGRVLGWMRRRSVRQVLVAGGALTVMTVAAAFAVASGRDLGARPPVSHPRPSADRVVPDPGGAPTPASTGPGGAKPGTPTSDPPASGPREQRSGAPASSDADERPETDRRPDAVSERARIPPALVPPHPTPSHNRAAAPDRQHANKGPTPPNREHTGAPSRERTGSNRERTDGPGRDRADSPSRERAGGPGRAGVRSPDRKRAGGPWRGRVESDGRERAGGPGREGVGSPGRERDDVPGRERVGPADRERADAPGRERGPGRKRVGSSVRRPGGSAPGEPERERGRSRMRGPEGAVGERRTGEARLRASVAVMGSLVRGEQGVVALRARNTGEAPTRDVYAAIELPPGVTLAPSAGPVAETPWPRRRGPVRWAMAATDPTTGTRRAAAADPPRTLETRAAGTPEAAGWRCRPVRGGARCARQPLAPGEAAAAFLRVQVARDAPVGAGPRLRVEAGALRLSGRASAGVRESGAPARFAADGKVTVRAVGNALLTCPVRRRGCTEPERRDGGRSPARPLDADRSPRTDASSAARLSLPEGGSVLWAGLYWSATAERAGPIRLRPPGRGRYVTVRPSRVTWRKLPHGPAYQAVADVTGLVAGAAKSGAWWAADPPLGGRGHAGWSLVVVTTDPAAPYGNALVVDAARVVGGGAPVLRVPLDGLEPAGAPARVELVAWAGDGGVRGDRVSLGSGPLAPQGGGRDAGDVFDGSANGASGVTSGVDVDTFSAFLRARPRLTIMGGGDVALFGVAAVSVRTRS